MAGFAYIVIQRNDTTYDNIFHMSGGMQGVYSKMCIYCIMYIVIITTIDTIERLQEIKIYDVIQTRMARTVLTCLLLYLLLCGQLRAESGPIILPLEIIRFQYKVVGT